MHATSVRAIRSWVRLESSFAAFNASLRDEFGITGLQLGVLRILAEDSPQPLALLRRRLSLHPATLGQAIDGLVKRGLCASSAAREDQRAKIISVTKKGRDVLARAPIAGPVRLRTAKVDPERTARLADALDDAIALFGFERWAPAAMAAEEESDEGR